VTGGDNFGQYRNPAVDQGIRAAERASDLGVARERWDAVLATIVDDAPAIWIYSPIMVSGIDRRFEDVTLRPDSWLAGLWRWRVPPDRYIDRDRSAP
jgi:ABC-type transport system substrate-binding protein